jgi:hypothetical protein
VAVLPVPIGAAILRYRLYDLDRIISRTLAYGVLTVLLGGGYVGVVLGLGQLLRRPDDHGVQRPVATADQPGHLTTELLAVTDQTMQPSQVSLWPQPPTTLQGVSSTASSAQRQGTDEPRH